ncbi:lysozyme inhibitor LprI family protein [Mesorhizobium sp. M2A.F.Ca.ET.042.01.1.1]|uniref:lysozyme inhibitor LprI family protein n=1 Tax=Mesorhizobium sp. M2A.F.Ca.ET.042.01.1.1 TaxID=2496745 RepID=UPI00167C21F8|nr:lysozyme inhibitor LprI family protein [Mesorhizobium sp. M2A.F.Ca.ET.042.01.1.1]
MLASVGVLLATLSPVTAVEKLRASDKAALAECLKYVGDFQGGVPGVNDTTPAIHIDNTIKLARHEPASCINYVTELCSFESDDGRSQLGLIDCANREVSVWEDRLNTTYAALMAKAAPKARDGYRKMQRAWIAYRDARCSAEASAETVNTDRQNNIMVSCALDATARQALILDDELSDLQ